MLSGFKLLDRFREILRPPDIRRIKSRRENDTRRKFDAEDYLIMVLFTLLNPVISSMRGSCALSGSKQLAKQTGIPRVCPGSFSEAQAVFAPDVLRGVLRELLGQVKSDPPPALREVLKGRAVEAIDSTLWEVISRMGWAHWRDQFSPVRMPCGCTFAGVSLVPAAAARSSCPRKHANAESCTTIYLEPEIIYVGDRNCSGDYGLLECIGQIGSDFVVRLQDQAVIHELARLPISPADQAKGIPITCESP